jgi:sulfide:quinone oxidoreductase
MARTSAQRHGTVRVLILGGGVAGLETALALRELGDGLFDVEIVAPEHHFFYRPLAVAEPFDVGHVYRWELADLARAASAQFTPGALDKLDTDAQVAYMGDGRQLEYEIAVLACGARPEPAIAGAFTFRGPADAQSFRALLDEFKTARSARRLLFTVPSGIVWPLPLYELALMSALELEEEETEAEIALATSEPAPLALFGEKATAAMGAALADRHIDVHARTYAGEVTSEGLSCASGGTIAADRVVALPRFRGPLLSGVPTDRNGFVPTDPHGRVRGAGNLYAAGDITDFPIKQGGLATQQADAVADAIAADAGAIDAASPFRPVLQALVLTGGRPIFLRVDLGGGRGETSIASDEPLWWPPGKIVGRHLAPFLADAGLMEFPRRFEEDDFLRIDVDAADWHQSLWRE